jgi:hypothetical protein
MKYVAAVLFFAVALAACGGDANTSQGTAPSGPSASRVAALGAFMTDTGGPTTCAFISMDGTTEQYHCTWPDGTGSFGPDNTDTIHDATVLVYPDGSWQLSPGGQRSQPGEFP